MLNYLFALICVIALSAGQVLFKAAAVSSKESSGFVSDQADWALDRRHGYLRWGFAALGLDTEE